MDIKGKSLSCWMAALVSVGSLVAADGDLRLVQAVKNKDQEAVRSLLKQNVDVNARLGDGSTALAWAAHWDDLETADLLIRAGADVNGTSDYGVSPLWEACNNGSAAMVEKLANIAANTNTVLRGGETALMRCARTGNGDAVKALLARGADVNVKDTQRGQTPLMWALEERHPDVVRVLIDREADVRARTRGGFTPLMFAARQGDMDSARLLLGKGADVNEASQVGLNALLVAADSGREEFAIFLLQQGANPDAADADGLTALHYSLRKGISGMRGSQHDPGSYGEVSLSYMFRSNMSALVRTLLEHGANPNARIVKGGGRHQPARASDRPKLAMAGATPYLLAAATGDTNLMRALAAKGADPKLGTNDGVTPLMAAAGVGMAEDRAKEEQQGALEAVQLLVELGADVNAVSKDGWRAVHGAAYTGANEIIQFLVEKGARLDVRNKYGHTPLAIADGDPNYLTDAFERRLHPDTAELIRKLGGDPLAGDPSPVAVNSNP